MANWQSLVFTITITKIYVLELLLKPDELVYVNFEDGFNDKGYFSDQPFIIPIVAIKQAVKLCEITYRFDIFQEKSNLFQL